MPLPFLALSGIPVPVSMSSGLRYSPVLLGEKVRTFSGYPRSSARRKLMAYEGGTGPLSLAASAALRALIDGEGDSWSFAGNLLSSRGLWPNAVGTPTALPSFGRYEGYALALSDGQSVSWATQLGEDWTVGYWARVLGVDGVQWHHYVQRSDGTVCVDAAAPGPHLGHTWSFDDGFTSNWGLEPSDVDASVSEPGRYGQCATFGEGTSATWPTQLGSQWTVAYWARLETDSTWHLYLHRAGLPLSRDGVVGSHAPSAGALIATNGNYTQLPDGAVYLLNRRGTTGPGIPNVGGVPLLIDDLVVLPYTVPDSWVAPWFASTAPFRLPGTTGLAEVDDNGALTVRHRAGVAGGVINPFNYSLLVSDLVALPYRAPDAWLAPWRDSGAPFGPLPYHRATGAGLHRPALVLGDAGQGDAMEWWEGAQRVQGEDFAFTLQEAP
ncbi:hypothetical protein [Myxococcus virescens]|uniref:Uncharacterized protein n=1 Tax=Myxococcus virescens TaxID=83456 RepID=A0A511HPN2_9BACT|nr:hypothetical protein [Myxococcus virescens]GEL75551.1 hypothetical protein MVI01_73350 [Myxococcus virescens]SDE65055.1 hypothetical protein SAMN04488504_109272 [Myxococcus virescens]